MLFQLLKHYENVVDGRALQNLWNELRSFPYPDEPEEIQIHLLKFVLNCIKCDNKSDNHNHCHISRSGAHDMTTTLCNKLEAKFIDIVFVGWDEIVKFFSSWQIDNLVKTMIDFCTPEKPLSAIALSEEFQVFLWKF